MVLATRCPHCETVFRVQEAQLARSNGRVRCGHCNEVFVASDNLLDPTALASRDTSDADATHAVDNTHPTTRPAQPASADEAPPHAPIESALPIPPEPVPEPVPKPVAEPAHPMEPAGEEAQKNAPVEPVTPTMHTETTAPVTRAPTEATETIESHRHETTPQRPSSTFAGFGDTVPPHEPAVSTAAPPQPDASPEPRDERADRTPRTHGFGAAPSAHDDEPRLPLDDLPPAWRADPEPRFRMPPTPGSAPEADDDGVHFAVTRERRAAAPRHAFRRVAGVFLCLVLLVLLLAQLAWWRREAVMVYWPDSQPLFMRACAQLGCQIVPPRDIDGLQVEASDLRQVDGPHRLELRVPLRNRYNVALAYPAIELTLFDAKNEIAIRRVLWPQDYLPPGTAVATGLPAHATQTMIVRLDSGNAVATNFRVQIFYP